MSQTYILELIRKNPGIKRKNIKELSGLSDTTIHYQINMLRKHGLIICKTGKNRSDMLLYLA